MQHETSQGELTRQVRAAVLMQPADPHVRIYARLMHARAIAALEATLPRTSELVGHARLAVWAAGFLTAAGGRSPYFRDVCGELLRHVLAEPNALDGLPAHAADLARYELCCFEVGIAPRDPPHTCEPLALARPVRFTRASAVLCLDFAVYDACKAPRRAPATLLFHRDPTTHRAKFQLLSSATAPVMAGLHAGSPLAEAIRSALPEHASGGDALLTELTLLFTDLAQRGIVLGADHLR
jgi:hypothetical protein